MGFENLLTPTIPLTILIEGLVFWLWCRARCEDFRRILITLTLANLLTQALLIAALTLSPLGYWPTLLAMEIFIVVIEALVLRLIYLHTSQAFVLSLLVNAASFGIGLALPF